MPLTLLHCGKTDWARHIIRQTHTHTGARYGDIQPHLLVSSTGTNSIKKVLIQYHVHASTTPCPVSVSENGRATGCGQLHHVDARPTNQPEVIGAGQITFFSCLASSDAGLVISRACSAFDQDSAADADVTHLHWRQAPCLTWPGGGGTRCFVQSRSHGEPSGVEENNY